MKIETTAGMLAKACKVLQRVALKRGVTAPVLEMAKFSEGRMTVSDLDRTMSVALPNSGFVGETCLPFWPLKRLVDAMDHDAALTIQERDAGGVAIIHANGRYVLPSLPASEFPEERAWPNVEPISCGEAGDLAPFWRAMAFALPFASREETRYYLNGVCLFGHAVVSTDGHRLAVTEDVLSSPVTNVIIPNSAVKAALDMPVWERVSLRRTEDGTPRDVVFEGGGVRFSARLIDGTFPDVRRVMPQGLDSLVRFNRVAALRVLRRLQALAGPRLGVSLKSDDGKLALGCVGTGDESGYEEIEAEGGGFRRCFNREYLIELLQATSGDVVSLRFKADSQEGFEPTTVCGDDEKRFIVSMPLRGQDRLSAMMDLRGELPPLVERKRAA